MPLYEYACPDCRSEFELLIRGQENPVCPECGTEKVERLLSVPAAPSVSGGKLPQTGPIGGGCGRPQCASGGCMGLGD